MKSLSFTRLLSDYGMLIVLILLCVFYSITTLDEQNPRGADGADQVVAMLLDAYETTDRIVVVAKSNPEHVQFADAMVEQLAANNFTNVERIDGEPPAVREAFETMDSLSVVADAIAIPQDYSTIVGNIKNRLPAMSQAKIVAPRSYQWPTFLLANNLRNVANQIVVIAIIAVGMTMVIITAGIDLSVGSLIAFSAVLAAWIIRGMGGVEATVGVMLFASIIAILMCGLVGFASGSPLPCSRSRRSLPRSR